MEQRNRSSAAIGLPSYFVTATTTDNIIVRVERPLTTRESRCIALCPILVFVPLLTSIVIFGIHNYPKFGLKSLSVSDFNISGSEITGNWNAEFLVRNPDFDIYWYDNPVFSVLYKNRMLSAVTMDQEIYLESRSKTKSFVSNGSITLSRRIVDDNQVADSIARDYWSQGGVVAFTVRLLYADGKKALNVTCGDVKVIFSNHSSHGTLMLLDQLQYSPDITNE
ncbi:hypothetical protein CCACVL1_17772 [Corchorus capsularis]|uniref:Late embryogenesis abundant protein, LEA-14 n=1 Tax=Corchorus capsularis TaxID=210143 RepID=A0A1R3HQ29_COCAP|nr:hypothetical protein CCACVL1_17772 [Corchorus capsularis]